MNSNDILQKEISNWFKNEERVRQYINGIESLERSGIFPLLQRLGLPSLVRPSDLPTMAGQAFWSNGYQTSIEYLRYFIERWQEKVNSSGPLVPDFGGEKDAVKRGDLRAEELK